MSLIAVINLEGILGFSMSLLKRNYTLVCVHVIVFAWHMILQRTTYQMLYESMVSLVLRQYMRGENVLLIQIGKQNVKIIEK